MNSIYRVIWNSSLNKWVVTSEISRSKGKTKSSSFAKKGAVLALGAIMGLSSVVNAQVCTANTTDCDLSSTLWNYTTANHYGSSLIISDGGNHTLQGPLQANIAQAKPIIESLTPVSLRYVVANGWVDNKSITNMDDYKQLSLPTETIMIESASGVLEPFTVYGKASQNTIAVQGTQVWGNIAKSTFDSYYHASFAHVTKGTLNVNQLDSTYTLNSQTFRNTALLLAESNDVSAPANIVVDLSNAANNAVHFKGAAVINSAEISSLVPNQQVPYSANHYVLNSSVLFEGVNHPTSTLAEFNAFNDVLIAALKNKRITIAQYNTYYRSVYTVEAVVFNFTVPSDFSAGTGSIEFSSPLESSGFLVARGKGASVEIAAGTTIEVSNTNLGSNPRHGAVVIENGASGVNKGTLLVDNATSYAASLLQVIDNGSVFTNNNLIQLGTAKTAPQLYNIYLYSGTLINTGTINGLGYKEKSTYYQNFFYVTTQGTFENSGVINLFYNEQKTDVTKAAQQAMPFRVAGVGSAVYNKNGAIINFGISPDGTKHTEVGKLSRLFSLESGSQKITNEGTINSGNLLADTALFYIGSSSNSTIINGVDGTINLSGNLFKNSDGTWNTSAMAYNDAIYYLGTGKHTVTNAGTINVTGISNIALRTTGGGLISSSGVINVIGDYKGTGLNNYGAWADGKSGVNSSIIDISGSVNIKGHDVIGVYANNGGTVKLSGAGNITFGTNGAGEASNQLGIYIYGAGSSLVNESTGELNVTADDSTLMRLAGGAAFEGSTINPAHMIGSGKNSEVLLGTDTGTIINSGSTKVDLTGEGSTGFLIQGGAVGNIADSAVINISAEGAIAGIADGKGSTLAGQNASITAGTTLTSAADLSSIRDGVTGYIARNESTLTNAGNIDFSGKNTTGLSIEEGSTGTNSGNITIGLGGQGLVASSTDKDTKLTNTGSLTLNGDFTSEADRTIGVSASGSKVAVEVNKGSGTGPVITLDGAGAVGVKAEAGSKVTLDDSVQMAFNSAKSDQIGFWASGAGSTISTEAGATAINVHGKGATLFFVDEGASLAGKMNVDLVGSDANAINSALRVSGVGSNASIAKDSIITIGNNSTGVYAEAGGSATIAEGVEINLVGTNAYAGQAIGADSKVINAAEIKSNNLSNGAVAFYAEAGGMIENTGLVDLTLGNNNTAIKVINGTVKNSSDINVNGTGIYIEGANAKIENTGTIVAVDGTASIRVSGGAELALSGGGTVTAEGTADAILLDTGTKSFVVSGATINVNKTGSTGIGINNKAGIAGIKLTNTTINVANGVGISSNKSLDVTNSGLINIAGSGTGIKLDNAGAALAENINLSNSSGLTINVTGAGGQGIVANIGSSNTFKSTAKINVDNTAGGSAIKLTGGESFTQGGAITSKSGDVIDAQNVKAITNTGTITAGDNTKAAIVMGEQDILFANSGSITGILNFKGGNNTVALNNGSSADGLISFGAGDNVVTVDNATAGNVTAGNGKLAIEVKGSSSFGNLAAGTGATDTLTFTGANYTTTSGQAITGFETLALQSASTFTTDTVTVLPAYVGLITIDADSTLALNNLSDGDTLINGVTGTGTITVNSGNQKAFNLGQHVSSFYGTVALTDTSYALSSGYNTDGLLNATLEVGDKALVTVAQGAVHRTIGGLTFNKGTVAIDTAVNIPGGKAGLIDNHIKVTNTLDLTNGGTIQLDNVDLTGSIDVGSATANLSILDQQALDPTLINVGLIQAGSITGSAGGITLVDKSGATISGSQKVIDLTQGSTTTKAKGTYDIRAGNTATELYVGYGLSQLELMTSGADAFNLSTANATNKTFDAKITGTGDLAVNAGTGADALTIANVNNVYEGKTLVQTGKLKLGSNNVLGKTSELNLAASTGVDINKTSQTIGVLNTAADSTLNFNAGDLTVTNGGLVSGYLVGGLGATSSALNLTGGTLTINSENIDLTIDTTISNSAILNLNEINGLGGTIGSSVTVKDAGSRFNVNDTGLLYNRLKGVGEVAVSTGKEVVLKADNKDFTGTYIVESTAKLIVIEEQHIGGATAITNDGTLNVSNNESFNLASTIGGTGKLVKDSAGTLTITGTNTYAGNTVVNKGVVAVSANANLGANTNSVVLSGGKLQLTGSDTFNHALELTKEGAVIVDVSKTATLSKGWSGAGNTLVKEGAGTLVLEGNNSANTGDMDIDLGTLQVEAMTNIGDTAGDITVAANGTLSILKTTAADETIERTLLGSGLVAVDLGDVANKLTLGANNTGAFTGQVSMNKGTFDVNSSNSTALTNGVLALHKNSVGNLTSGNHTIGGLIIDGTHLNVATKSGAIDTLVNVKTLAVTSNGGSVTLQGGLPIGGDITLPMGASALSFFDQYQLQEQIVSADTVTQGAGTQLTLLDDSGNPVGNTANSKLKAADGTEIGTASYGNIALAVSDVALRKYSNGALFGTGKGGIFLTYGLTQLDANAGQTITLSNTAGQGAELGTLLTGKGGFTIDAVGDVHIGNAQNSYEGATTVNSGTVHLLSNSALGKTSELTIKDQAGVNLAGMNQTVGMLNTEVGSTLDFNAGNLTITSGGAVSGALVGASGTLRAQGATPLTITGDNSALKIDALIDTNSEIVLQHANALGTSIIKNEGTLTLDQVNGTFANNLSGQAGTLQLTSSDVTLGGYNGLFYGAIAIDQNSHLTATSEDQLGFASVDNSGQMTLDVDKVLMWNLTTPISGTGELIKTGEGVLTVDSAQTYIGKTTIEGGLMLVQSSHTSIGSLASSSVEIKQSGALGGYGSVAGDVANKGTILVGSATNNFNDFGAFTIKGNYIGQGGTVILGTVLANDASQSDRLVIQGDASGQSYIVINNVRGSGAQTSNGIEVVDIAGNSSAQFDLVGRAVAGAYEYNLNRGTDGNWYLQSEKIDDGTGTGTSAYRPEAGGYLANIAAVNSLFTHQLTDRMQQSVGKDGRSAWVRIVGNHGKFRDSSNQLSTSTNNQVVQVGGDIVAQQLANNGLIKFGALFGYGHTKSTTRGYKANVRTRSSGDGYALGLYGTWFQNSADLTGAYVDTWIQYVHFENKVKGSYLQNESYDAKGVVASIEAGYTFKITPNFFIQPQAQVTWMNVKADDHRESNGTYVRSGGQGNVQTRVGARAFGEFDLSNGGKLRPYAELNWLHNTKSYYVDMDGTRINQQGAKNIGQIKAGINTQFNDQLSIWGDLSHDIGKHSYRNTKVSLGLKYTF